MSYGQQPDPNNPNVPPVPPAPGYGAPNQPPQTQPYGAPASYGTSGQPSYGASSQPGYATSPQPGYGAPGQQAYGQYGAPAQAGAPWAGAGVPMSRPGTVTAGSVLAFIGGGFMVVIGLLLAALGGSSQFADTVADAYGPLASMIVGLGVILMIIGALVIFFGVMAFKGRRWGAIALAVLAGLTVLGAISDLASGTGGSSFLGTAWSVLGAVLLLVNPSQAWYRSQQQR